MKPALVILAAGASRRLGQCKALATIRGRRVLEHLLDASRALDEVPPLVVTGRHHAEIEAAAPFGRAPIELLFNREWEAGRTGGILLAHQNRPGRDLLLAPVDVPLVPKAVFETLAHAWEQAGAPARGWLAPRYLNRFGHPLVVGRELLGDLEYFSADTPLRNLRGGADPLWSVEVCAPEIHDDLDTPEDLDSESSS